MKLSILLPTIGNWTLLERYLNSIHLSYNHISEVIIVDQSTNSNNLESYFNEKFPKLPLLWLCSERGLSLGRNIALEHVKGDILCFADDDCWYEDTTISKVLEFLKLNSTVDGLVLKSRNEQGEISFGKIEQDGTLITLRNHWHLCISYNIFLRVSELKGLDFDENLGVGSHTIYRSGEESDFIIRLLTRGAHIIYSDISSVYHPSTKHRSSRVNVDFVVRLFYYGCGFGAVHRKHGLLSHFSYKILRSTVMVLLGLFKRDKSYFIQGISILLGRLTGYFLYKYEIEKD